MIRFDVSQVLNAAFAVASEFSRFDVNLQDGAPSEAFFPTIPSADIVSGVEFYSGARVVAPLKFGEGEFKAFGARGELVTERLSALFLPPTTLVDYQRAKVATYTQQSGLGTVKEVFAFGDWVLNVYGVAFDYHGMTAEQQIEGLLQRERMADALPISGKLMELLNVSHVFIESFQAKQLAGFPGRIPFTFACLSDAPIEVAGYGIRADV